MMRMDWTDDVAHGISIRIGRDEFDTIVYIVYFRIFFATHFMITSSHKLMLCYLISSLHKLGINIYSLITQYDLIFSM